MKSLIYQNKPRPFRGEASGRGQVSPLWRFVVPSARSDPTPQVLVAKSHPDLTLQLGIGFNCAANELISLEMKRFSQHTAVGEDGFAPAPGSHQPPEKPNVIWGRTQHSMISPGLFLGLFFSLKELPVPSAVSKNCGCPTEHPVK